MESQIYSRECPYCKRIMESLSESQLAFNMGIHKATCKLNPNLEKDESTRDPK